ncbi:coiled-coil domain-containing protein 187 [Rhinoderma darwinii]|uniref:coiled-coil domain-containing protein 187 n=1 Tax=Rhinoderma darwinii TaxID=43563 RepID=UPI003F67B424
MSSKEDWDGTALETFSHVQDVSRAWDSLLEAKHVLQRIENKVDIQNQRRKQAQKIRRRLQLERNSFSGPDTCSPAVKDSSHLERQHIRQRNPDHTFTLHSEEPNGRSATFPSNMDTPWDLLSRTRPTLFLQEDKPSVASFPQDTIYNEKYHGNSTHKNILAESSQANFCNDQETNKEDIDHVLKASDLDLQTYIPEDEMEEIVNPYLAVSSPPSGAHIRPETITSLNVDLYVQNLEQPKSTSPISKLEKLKERIQEQKRRQNLLKRNPPKCLHDPEPLGNPVMRRKVGKVTFAPPAPYYKGCSAAEESVPVCSEEDGFKRERENLKKISHKNEGGTVFRSSREKSRGLKSKSPVTRKLSFRSPSPERKVKHSGLYGASAWREGQKLVQQILGPSPVILLKNRSPKTEDLHVLQKGRCQKIGSPNSLKHKHQPNTHVLVKRRIGIAQLTPEINAEEHQSRPACKMSGKDRKQTSDRSRSKSFSPKTPHATYNNMEMRPLGKENVEDHEGQPNCSKKRSYSVEQIRDFMKKKAIERQKIERENQMKMKKASRMRQQQLDNVLKKQKEAFPSKRAAISTAVSWKNPHIQPCEVENVRKNLSEWLHVTSNDLLKEDDGARIANSKKQKAEMISKDQRSSPLRLQDLVPVPTSSQDIQVRDIDSARGLNDEALSSHTADVFSQCRNHQERLNAIWTTAKDLGRRVELECNRLGSPNFGQHSGTSVSSPSPSQMISASDEPFIAGKNLAVNVTKLPEDNEGLLPTSVYTGSCWIPDSAKVPTGPVKKNRLRINKDYKEKTISQTKMLHPEIHSETTQKGVFIRRSASTSPHRGSDVNRPKLLRDKSFSPPRRKTPSPRKAASPKYSDKETRVIPHPKESCSPVSQMGIAGRIKSQLQQQEKDLAALRLKAELEATEAQRCLEEMLRRNNRQSPGLKNSSSEKQVNNKKQHSHRQESEKDRVEAGLAARMELDQHGTSNVTQQNTLVTAHVSAAPTETKSLEYSWEHTEPATDSTSKWSEVGEFYGSPNMFTRFSLEMSQQYLREEELRARHQTALLRLREEALKEKTKAELALLNHQKTYWQTNDPSKMEELLSQEGEIQRNLKQEQAEIRHLHNIYKAAHQERKLLLRQQKEILRIQQSAAHVQQKLHNSGVSLQAPELTDLDPSTQQSRHNTFRDSTLASEDLNQDTQSAVSDLSEDDDIAEITHTMKTFQTQMAMDKSTSPVPEVCDKSSLRKCDPQGSKEAEEKADYIAVKPDGAAEGNSLPGDRTRVTGSLCPTSPTTPEDLSNHSPPRQWDPAHEEISVNNSEVEIFVNMQDADRIAAGEHRNNLPLKNKGKKREPAEVESAEELTQDLPILATQETASDNRLVTEPINDHSSQSISAPSNPEILSRALHGAALSPSLAEFQKVSAKLIEISESSISASDRGQGGEDTESGDSEVFDIESPEVPGGQLDKQCGEKILNQDEKNIKGDLVSEEDKSKPTSSPSKPPDSRKPVILVLKETQSKTETAPLACESFPTSEDLTESDTKTYGINHTPENRDRSEVSVTDIQKSTSMSPKEDGNAAEMSSPDTKDRHRVTETNEKQSVTESAICRKIEMMPFHATTSKDLFQIKSFPHRSQGDIIFITDQVLQPIEDTLSEILSPVDEKLSYDSADWCSPQQDQSEELPSLPRDPGSVRSGESDTEDFPTPPEEILLSRTESLQSSREASLIDEIHLLYDSLLTEDTLLPPDDGNHENSQLETENTKNSPAKPCRPFLTSKVEDGVHDPLSTFEIGDRVLVKLSKPGTLMFKGLTSFKEGFWAGVALDKPDGDNDGRYEGIRYFHCSMNCGVFVRPGQISHLLFDEMDGSDPQKDEDDDFSFGDGPSPRDFPPQDQGGEVSRRRQCREKDKGKNSSEKDINQSRLCSLESSENNNDVQVASPCQPGGDLSPRGLHTFPDEPRVENKTPGQDLQIQQFCRGDNNRLIVPNPPQDNTHRLLLKVTDELISRVLCDAIWTYSKISREKFETVPESVINSSQDEDEKCVVPEEGFCNLFLSMTTREAGGQVEASMTDVMNDRISEYQKIKCTNGKEKIQWSSVIYSSPFLAAGNDRTSSSQFGYRKSALVNFTDGICEELVKDSFQVIANIHFNRAQS